MLKLTMINYNMGKKMEEPHDTTMPDIAESEEEKQTSPWKSPVVQIVLLSTLLAPLGVPFVSPSLPLIQQVFLVSEQLASLAISTYFIVGIVFSPFIGSIIDRVDERRVLAASLVLFGVSGGITVFVFDFWLFILLRVIQGTAAAGLFIATVTLITANFEGVQKNSVLGMNNAVLSLGAAIFPILGGAIVAISWNAPFAVYLVAIPIGYLAMKRIDCPKCDATRGGLSIRSALKSLKSRKMVVPYSTAVFSEIILFGAVFTTLPFFLSSNYSLNPLSIGFVVSIGSIASAIASVVSGKIAKYITNRQMIALAFFFNAIGLIGLWAAPTLILTIIAASQIGAAVGFSLPAVDARISTIIDEKHRGEALSIRNSFTFLGRTLGPILFTGIAAVTGYPSLLLWSGILCVLTVVVLSVAYRSKSD
ncbi:MAG: putative arabinose efflux permease, MFS family [Candidatus Thorarchaeota archaeon]|nr:MAG: putative arabinose efflux permease, MFS family [Candidatus Thorarchaeota archaeon]